ncbi:MAG: hypothetical protein JNG84_15515 [Archangium sp.]|nr:hypothetical protein [Archangium sp.]
MFSLESHHAATGCRLVILDDGRAATAYFHGPDGDILGDVWLYNRVAPPESLSLDAVPPFLNPLGAPLDQALPDTPDVLAVAWTYDADVLWADVLVRGVVLARLSPGSQPGWNRLAEHEGPLAVPFPPDA